MLHYEVGQKYEPHFDYFLDEFNTMNGGQRMATLLMYLYVSPLCTSWISLRLFYGWFKFLRSEIS